MLYTSSLVSRPRCYSKKELLTTLIYVGVFYGVIKTLVRKLHTHTYHYDACVRCVHTRSGILALMHRQSLWKICSQPDPPSTIFRFLAGLSQCWARNCLFTGACVALL
jgi:hypothetical protein